MNIVILILEVIILGLQGFLIQSLIKKSNYFDSCIKEDRLKTLEEFDFLTFDPYLIRIMQDAKTYSEDKIENGQVKEGEFYSVIYEKDGLLQLSNKSFIDKSIALANPTLDIYPFSAKIKQRCDIYNGPSITFKIVGTVQAYQLIEVLDKFGAWYKVKIGNMVGYIYYENIIR